MNTFLRNTISKLYNGVSAPVAATRDALVERLQGVRDKNLKKRDVRPTKLVNFEGIARHHNVNIMLYEPKKDR